MFGGSLGDETRRYFERLLAERSERLGATDPGTKPRSEDGDAATPFLNFAIPVPRRYQTVIPAVGTLHDCCETCGQFSAISSRLLMSSIIPRGFGPDGGGGGTSATTDGPRRAFEGAFLIPELASAADGIAFHEYAESEAVSHRNAYYSVANSYKAMRSSEAFGQLVDFMQRFAKLLATSFGDVEGSGGADGSGGGGCGGPPPSKKVKVDVPTYDKTHGTLELFQKMILMHATYFLASVVLGDHAERADEFLRMAFDTPNFSNSAVRHFRQRATVFLVPRRHGKTWFLVPLIALALAAFKGIRIGYTSHIQKAVEPVFEAIDARLRSWFGPERTYHVKGETILFSFPDGTKSKATFASSHNTNSIRGQDFNLLFVDEANFIRPDAVQTIVGFLNQANCKIIFVSSTNSGKASTSFLYSLKGSADDLLNVVTYICDEHMKHVTAHTSATACSCYVLNKPVFITMDGAMRRTAELFLPDSFMQEIIGGGGAVRGDAAGGASDGRMFTSSAIDRFLLYRPSTVNNRDVLSQELYVYVDPAFTANTRASGTGVAVVGRYGHDYLVFGLEHFFLRALTGDASDAIGSCVAQCLAQICSTHERRFASVNVVVEGNSSQDSAVAIAARIDAEICSYSRSSVGKGPIRLSFYHTVPPNSDIAYPMFLLQRQKTEAFDFFIKTFNSGRVLASQDLVSITVSLDTDPAEYLTRQMMNLCETVTGPAGTRSFTGKKNGGADDTMVALVMAVYMSTCVSKSAFVPLSRPDF